MQSSGWLRWLKVAVGLGLLAFIGSRVDPRELAQLLRRGDGRQLALGLGLLLLANPIMQALRLHVLVARYTERLAVTLKIFFVSAFFNSILPSNLGGDAIRLMYLRQLRADNWGGPFALLLLHRASGMFVLLFAAAVYAALQHARLAAVLRAGHVQTHVPLPALALAALLLAALVVGWFVLPQELRSRLSASMRGFAANCASALLQVGAPVALGLLVLTLGFHFLRMLAFYVLVHYAGESVGLWDLSIVLAVTALAGVIPITAGGLGLVEGAISITLALYGVSEGAALAVAIANRLVLLVGAAAGGLVYLGARDARGQPSAQEADGAENRQPPPR
jgi:glycosyltransferase 2 family protein